MFDKSPSWNRFSQTTPSLLKVHLGYTAEVEDDTKEQQRRSRVALGGAVLVHAVLFLALPFLPARAEPQWTGPERPVYVVTPVKFKAPEPKPAQEIPKPKRKKKTIPVPDPTPLEPEPVFDDVSLPEIDTGDIDLAVVVPDAPAEAGTVGAPLWVGNGITPPVKVFAPSPRYSEEARQGRIQGVVLLQAIIDEEGKVADIEVLKGLPLGLTESAVDTTKTWTFEPARQTDGTPVAVYFTLTVSFSLQ